MNNYMEYKAKGSLIGLEAVMPGVIRCVYTKEEQVKNESVLAERSGVSADNGAFYEMNENEGWLRRRSAGEI